MMKNNEQLRPLVAVYTAVQQHRRYSSSWVQCTQHEPVLVVNFIQDLFRANHLDLDRNWWSSPLPYILLRAVQFSRVVRIHRPFRCCCTGVHATAVQQHAPYIWYIDVAHITCKNAAPALPWWSATSRRPLFFRILAHTYAVHMCCCTAAVSLLSQEFFPQLLAQVYCCSGCISVVTALCKPLYHTATCLVNHKIILLYRVLCDLIHARTTTGVLCTSEGRI